MKLQYKPLLLAFVFALPNLATSALAVADTFPCNTGAACSIAPVKPQHEQGRQGINWDKETATYSFLNGLVLTNEQRNALSDVLDKQMPEIYNNINALDNARALLREMALSKNYDDALARIATERIAKSTATLAILQAEREYQIFALLTPEQTKQFEKLKAKGEIKLM